MKAGGRRMRIAIATLGRFHALDLARELAALGHEVHFYSWVPRSRAVRFGLPPECHVSLLVLMFPFAALQWLLPSALARLLDYPVHLLANLVVRLRLRPCEVFIGMSGIYLEAAEYARGRFRALVFMERGSRHILSQQEILAAIPQAAPVPRFAVERELRGYALADRVVVPSRHVAQSFIEKGYSETRLIRNPYGVDIEAFTPRPRRHRNRPVVLYVGAWSLQKGVDVLIEAVNRLDDVELLHIGSMTDGVPSSGSRVRHVGVVDQTRLPEFYSEADVFTLPSRQDGFGLVLLQALACGLPVVCTDRTAGADIKELVDHPEAISVVPAGDAVALERAIEASLRFATQNRGRDFIGGGRESLSWRAYGLRYESGLREVLGTI